VSSGAHKMCRSSETVYDRTKFTIADHNRKLHTRFRLAPISATLDHWTLT